MQLVPSCSTRTHHVNFERLWKLYLLCSENGGGSEGGPPCGCHPWTVCRQRRFSRERMRPRCTPSSPIPSPRTCRCSLWLPLQAPARPGEPAPSSPLPYLPLHSLCLPLRMRQLCREEVSHFCKAPVNSWPAGSRPAQQVLLLTPNQIMGRVHARTAKVHLDRAGLECGLWW